MRHARITAAVLIVIAALVGTLSVTAVDRDEAQQNAAIDRIECTLYGENCPEPTATATPEPTATAGAPTLGWHAPSAHDGLNGHEHGDAPPRWVIDSPNQPFTQNRESHTGYKGEMAVSPGGAESYLIAHILSTESARSHGDHDYQLWLRDPDTGAVFYQAGVLCFAQPCDAPTREMTFDDGQRPIVLGERNASDGCETWYSDPADPNVAIDLGWTICGRYQAFNGTVLGGEGSFRTIDWVIPCAFIPQGHPLRDECRLEFGIMRLSWLANNQDYGHPAVEPIN